MKFAYADPPYLGQAERHYGDHPDYGGEVDHAELIAKLERDFDGWALSSSAKELWRVLPLCPPGEPSTKRPGTTKEGTGTRLLAWHKTMVPVWPQITTYSFEIVILRGWRNPPAGTPPPRDVHTEPPAVYRNREHERPDNHVIGAKPPGFCRWLFACAGLTPEDEFVDVFTGSGGVAAAWERYCNESPLEKAMANPEAWRQEPRHARKAMRGVHPELDLGETIDPEALERERTRKRGGHRRKASEEPTG